MRVMVLVPAVPKTMESKFPWHFFQELRPMAQRGVRFCVLSEVQPDYEIPGVEFRQITRRSLKSSAKELAGALRFAWDQRAGMPSRQLGDMRNIFRLSQWNALVLQHIQQWRPDIIHCHWAFPIGSAGMLAARKMQIPFIMTLRGIEHQIVPQCDYGLCLDRFYEKTLTAALHAATRITVCCSDSVTRIKALGIDDPSKIVHIYHAIDTSRFVVDDAAVERLGRTLQLEGKRVILCVAWMEIGGRKGHHDLIEAFARLFKEDADTVLLLVGEGLEKGRLMQLARDHGVADQVIFYGGAHPNEIPCFFKLATLSVLPTHCESFANVVFESLICGTPVISSAVGTPADVLPLGPYGFLFEAGNVDQLCERLRQAFSDIPTARAMAERGGQYVRENMDIENRVSAFMKTYHDILGDQALGRLSATAGKAVIP